MTNSSAARELGDDLVARAEDVRVVLGHAPDAGESVHDARLLVAVDRPELEEAQREVAVRPHAAAVDQDVERAVHRLEVVVGTAVELHRRVHAVGEPVEVPGDLEEVRLRDVRRVDELVARFLVSTPRVVLHDPADGAALRVEHREAGPDLVGEGEQVELGAELAVVALLGLLEAAEVLVERGLRLPRGAVDALEHRTLLVAPPVRARDLGELERTEPLGGRHVGAAAQVDELGPAPLSERGVRVAVHRDDVALADLGGVFGVDPFDDLDLVGLIGEGGDGVLAVELLAHEGLVGLDDLAHAGLDAFEVVSGEVPAVRQLEVVVEAVGDGGADGVLRAREEVGDGLRHHVRSGVAQHLTAVVGVGGDDRDACVVLDGTVEVVPLAVDPGRQRGLGEPTPDRRRDLARGDTLLVRARRSVGQRDRDRHGLLNGSFAAAQGTCAAFRSLTNSD